MRRILLLAGLCFLLCQHILAQQPQFRAFWVDAFHPGIKSPAETDELIKRAEASKINALVIQVRRRGDAYFLNTIDPVTEDPDLAKNFDALQYLIDQAHARKIEVHAWIIANAIWNSATPPSSRDHIFNLHGPLAVGTQNWLAVDTRGVNRFNGDYWVDPGHPGVVEYLVRVVRSLAANYNVDGIHFDRIRYPEVSASQGFFDIGYNAVSVQRFNVLRGRTGIPAVSDPQWSDWRRQQMTQMFRRLYLEMMDVNPRLRVSAALIAFGGPPTNGDWTTSDAYGRVFQDWQDWLRLGIIDMAMPMHYDREHNAAQKSWFDGWMNFDKDRKFGRHLVIGQGAFLNSIEGSLTQARRIFQPSPAGNLAEGVTYYSYATTNAATETLPLRDNNEFYTALSYSSDYESQPLPLFATTASVPEMSWKLREGMLLGRIVSFAGEPVDGADLTIKDAAGSQQMKSDGNGYFGASRLLPGAVTITIHSAFGTQIYSMTTQPGVVTRVYFSLPPPPARRRP